MTNQRKSIRASMTERDAQKDGRQAEKAEKKAAPVASESPKEEPVQAAKRGPAPGRNQLTRVASPNQTISGARSAASGRLPKSKMEGLMRELDKVGRTSGEPTLSRQLGLAIFRSSAYSTLDRVPMPDGSVRSLRETGGKDANASMNPEQRAIQAYGSELGNLEGAVETHFEILRAGSTASLLPKAFQAEVLKPLAALSGKHATLSPAVAIVSAASIRAALKDSASFSDAEVAPARHEAARRYVLQENPLPLPEMKVGATTLPMQAYLIEWDDQNGKTHYVGFKVPEAGESGKSTPDHAAKTKPIMAITGAMMEPDPQTGILKKSVKESEPLNDWLTARGIDPGKDVHVVLTSRIVEDLEAKGYRIRLTPTTLEDMVPEALATSGGERHVSGDLFIRGVKGDNVRIGEAKAAINACVASRLKARAEWLKPRIEADLKENPEEIDAMISLLDKRDRLYLSSGEASEDERFQAAFDKAMGTQLEDWEAQTRLALGDNQIELLQAVHRYAVALESVPSLGADPFLSTLRNQIEEEGKGTVSRAGFQSLDWLINRATANHGKKYEGMADHERHINVMRDAMDEMQALCEGGEAAKKVIDTYARGKSLTSIGCGRLNCLEDANKVALEEKFLLTVGPIMNASIDVDRQIKLVLADAVAQMMLADLGRFGLDSSANNAMHLRERVGVAMDNGVVDRFADRVEIGKYGERKEIKGEPKDEGIAKMDKAVAELLAQDAFGAYTHAEIKAMLSGVKPANAPRAYELAVTQARDAFRLVSEVANWEVAMHRKTGDVLRIPKAMAEITYNGAMKRPYPVTISFPILGGANIEKTGIVSVYVPLKGATTGKRWAVLESKSRGDGFLSLAMADEVSESKIAGGLDAKNSANSRIIGVGVAQPSDFSVADILKREMRAVDLGDGAFFYIMNVDGTSRLDAKLGHLKAGTFLPTIDPQGVDRFLENGRGNGAPMTHLLTKEGGAQRVVKVEFSEKGVKDLEAHLKGMRDRANLTRGEQARAEEADQARVSRFGANVQAYQEGARGAVVLLPGGQGQQMPDLTSMVVYKSESDMALIGRGEPALDGITHLKQMISERTESGCPVSQMIFKV